MNDMDYQEFLKTKRITIEPSGFEVDESDINPMLFDFQKDIVRWALRKGKAALFEDCGLILANGHVIGAGQWGASAHSKLFIGASYIETFSRTISGPLRISEP